MLMIVVLTSIEYVYLWSKVHIATLFHVYMKFQSAYDEPAVITLVAF